MEQKMREILFNTPFWEHLTSREKEMVQEQVLIGEFKKNQILSSKESACVGVVFVLKGGIRVSMISDEGREITLYRLAEGDCCVNTASCVMQQITFDTVVSASADATLAIIPTALCVYLAESNIYFRAYMYEIETQRFSDAIWVMQELLFKRFDQRLATYLLSEYDATGKMDLSLTQEEIARNVNSAREVVARMLRHFSREGLVEVKRGHIILKDIDGLKKFQ